MQITNTVLSALLYGLDWPKTMPADARKFCEETEVPFCDRCAEDWVVVVCSEVGLCLICAAEVIDSNPVDFENGL